MQAIVLAGGMGSRLRSVVADVPKPMAPVAGRPFLEYLLQALADAGFDRIVLSVGHMAQTIVDHFGPRHLGMQIDYEIESRPLGTGGATRAALRHIGEDHAHVLNGDTYVQFDAAEMERIWRERRTPVIVAREVDDTARFGRLDVVDGRVTRFCEKGVAGPGLINAGVYLLPRTALDAFDAGQTFSLEQDYLAAAVRETDIRVVTAHGLFIDIGVPEDYRRAQQLFSGFAA